MSICPFVRPGLGVCLGLFAHLVDFILLLITFKHCLGMLTKKHTHTLLRTHSPRPRQLGNHMWAIKWHD